MAIPPTIPTSFVPKQPLSSAPKKRMSGANPFLAVAYFVLGLSVLGAGLVFGYKIYLEGIAQRKEAQVIAAQQQIHQATVTEFIRLRDRFSAAKNLLDTHVALSQFLDLLEVQTLQGVKYGQMQVVVSDDRKAQVIISGTARTFNTLAAQSSAFAADKRIKRAIFSGISYQENAVRFELKAELDPSLVVLAAANPAFTAPVQPEATEASTPQATSTTP